MAVPPKIGKQMHELWLRGWSYERIAARMDMPEKEVIHAITLRKRLQDERCQKCAWRRDGQEICMLPGCMYLYW